MKLYKRQGDIYIFKTNKIEQELQSAKKLVVAEGEVTGHKHLIESDNDFYFTKENNDYMVRILEPTPLKHEEHKTVVLEPADYRIVRQREYDSVQYQRQVSD